jgi:hypothetical protein
MFRISYEHICDIQYLLFVGYQLLTKLLKLLLSNYNYFKYLCYMYIFLGLQDMLNKFTYISLVKFSVKYLDA